MSSVWTEMGFRQNGDPYGVDPYTFLSAGYAFWSLLREHCQPEHKLPPIDFDFATKRFIPWHAYEMPPYIPGQYYEGMGRPVPAAYWNGSPDWPTVLAMTEEQFLGEPVETPTFPYYVDMSKWPRQRRQIIRLTRYAIVPLKITQVLIGGAIDEETYIHRGIGWGGRGRGATRSLSVTFPDYWKDAATRKIGILGEAGKPVPGVFWTSADWGYRYPDDVQIYQQLWICGAVDLSTHPDFEQYFDT